MQKVREITISGFTGDPDWGADVSIALAPEDTILLQTGWVGTRFAVLFVDANGVQQDADATTFAYEVIHEWSSGGNVRRTKTPEVTGASGGELLRRVGVGSRGNAGTAPVRAALRITGAFTSPPGGATIAEIHMGEV